MTSIKVFSKKAVSVILSLLMILTVVPAMSLTAYAADVWVMGGSQTISSDQTCTTFTVYDSATLTVNQGVAPPYADLKNTTTVVTFDGKEWYLIDYDSSTVTLLAKECVAASQYNSSGSYVEYASSTVKTAVDNWYNNNITSNAKTAVFDNKMFLLTKDQANAMTTDTRKCSQASEANYNYWWLCSPGSFGNFASCVYGGNGKVLAYGYSVVYALGVRPALKLDLSKVEFDSATNTFAVASSHEHDFTYSVNGDTITATCTATGCDLTDDNEVTLTIVAPTLTIVGQTGDGISEYATLTGLEAFNEATGLNVAETDIKYYAVETYEIDGNTYKRQGNELDGAPTDAGEYIAGLTLSDVKISETATRDVTARTWYTITEPAPELFWKHSVTLGGDIGVNFYLDDEVLDTYTGAKTVTFSWDGNETTVDVPATATADGYKVTCNVVAAQMAHTITATLYVDGELVDTDDYSVQDYAETVFKNPTAYDKKGKPNELKDLAQALLNYGAMAQTVFATSLNEQPELANTVVGDNGYEGVTADQIEAAIKGESADLNAVATQLGAKYYTSSLIYLSRNTLRLYFTPTTYPGEIPNAGAYDGNLSGYYYYVDHANIPAAELDNQQTFNVNGTEFTFSALDYAKAVVESTKMEPEQKNLAKALYLYNQKANAYFNDAPAPVENVVDLGTLQGDYEAQNNDVLTGVLSGDKKISIADGATITLRDANITLSSSAQYAGITPLGDAKIVLDGTNTVKGGNRNYPGIYVPAGKTLIIDGTGSLNASSHGCGCGIGGGFEKAAGNTVINGGTITATGGEFAAGIGSGQYGSCGNITITGGTITANGGDDAAGIGSGDDGSCGNILITGGTVTANGRYTAAGIGSGYEATCGNITIADTVTQVTATKGKYSPNSIGAGDDGTCGTVTIEDGANVIQN